MVDMSVLYTTYQTAFQNPGGGETQLQKTCAGISDRGYYVDTFDPFESTIAEYDVLHAFSSHKDNVATASYAASEGVPVVTSPIYWNPMEYFRTKDGIGKYVKVAEELGKRAMRRAGITYLDKQQQLYDASDLLLPNSRTEAELLSRHFGVPLSDQHIVPNAVDERFADAKPDAFEAEYGLSDFVLFVGVLSPRKNLIRTLRALRGLNRDVVVVGPGDDAYVAECEAAAGTNVHFVGSIDHEDPLLESAYAACDTFVLPSWYETPGLAALEAGLAGATVAITDRGSTRDYFQDHAYYLDPTDEDSIRTAVSRALAADSDGSLADLIHENYLWSDTARETAAAYDEVT